MCEVTNEKIKKYLDENIIKDEKENYINTFRLLSNNKNIVSNKCAYNFDKIKEFYYKKARSCDALYINKNLNFIEFKTGYTRLNKDKKENIKLSIALKASHTLQLFETCILQNICNGKLDEKIKKNFYVVIDSANNPEDAYVDINESLAQQNEKIVSELLENVLIIYRGELKNKNKFMYDEAEVIFDYDFEKKLSSNKF